MLCCDSSVGDLFICAVVLLWPKVFLEMMSRKTVVCNGSEVLVLGWSEICFENFFVMGEQQGVLQRANEIFWSSKEIAHHQQSESVVCVFSASEFFPIYLR